MNEVNVKLDNIGDVIGYRENGEPNLLRLLKIEPAYKYLEGVKTSEKAGFYITALICGADWDKIRLTVNLEAKMAKVSAGTHFLPVGFQGRIYSMMNTTKVYYSLRCEDIAPINPVSKEG